MSEFVSDFWFGSDKEGIEYTNNSYSLIKMASFRRAVANFVTIVTGEDIPVVYNAKDKSFTNGKIIVLSAQIPNKQIDASVGLALHEAVHIIREDWDFMENFDEQIPENVYKRALSKPDLELTRKKIGKRIHGYWNWVRDRSNDKWYYEQAPGYRGYFTALYSKYFYRPILDIALQSSKFRTPSWKGYNFRIINLHNKNRDLDALPGLREIWDIVDLKNIDRIVTTQDAFDVALKMWNIVIENLINPPKVKKPKAGKSTKSMSDAELDDLPEEVLKDLMEQPNAFNDEDEDEDNDALSLPLPDDNEYEEDPEEPDNDPDEENEKEDDTDENEWEDNNDLVDIGDEPEDDEPGDGENDETGGDDETDETDEKGENDETDEKGENDETDENGENDETDENGQKSDSNDTEGDGDTETPDTDDSGSNTEDSDDKDTSNDDDDKPGVSGEDDEEEDAGENDKELELEDLDDKNSGEDDDDENSGKDDENSGEDDDFGDLTEAEEEELENAIKTQEDFLENGIEKDELSNKQDETLKQMDESGASVENTGKEFGTIKTVVIRKLTEAMLETLPIGNSSPVQMSQNAVNDGIRLGNLLGNKLQIRNETTETIYNRRFMGKIDKRRIHAVGYSDAVCQQTFFDEYGEALIHISIDASSSMDSADKWRRTLATAVAIAKATDIVDKLDVVISFRATTKIEKNVVPLIVIAYDSRCDKIVKIKNLFPRLSPNGWTPEGLAYEAIMDEILESVKGKEGYFINFSDGQPYCPKTDFGYNDVKYQGTKACKHTAKQVKKMLANGIKVLSFFIKSIYDNSEDEFNLMYGKNSSFINVEQIMNVAKEINKKLLSK